MVMTFEEKHLSRKEALKRYRETHDGNLSKGARV
jgi:hypothetical protein